MSVDDIILVLLIFALRVFNNGLGTIRIISMTYGRRGFAAILGFIESTVFAFTAAQVLTDLDNLPNLLAYSSGFAVGGYVGMYLEDRFLTGYRTVTITTIKGGHRIAETLRDVGYGVTETVGEGGSGQVRIMRVVVERKLVNDVAREVTAINPDAFITVEEARAVQRGWMNHRRLTRR